MSAANPDIGTAGKNVGIRPNLQELTGNSTTQKLSRQTRLTCDTARHTKRFHSLTFALRAHFLINTNFQLCYHPVAKKVSNNKKISRDLNEVSLATPGTIRTIFSAFFSLPQ